MESKDNARVLGEFSARKTGNSLVITIPQSAGVSEGKKFTLLVKNDGSLEYRSSNINPWLNGDYDDIDFRADIDKVGNYGFDIPQGKEKFDYES